MQRSLSTLRQKVLVSVLLPLWHLYIWLGQINVWAQRLRQNQTPREAREAVNAAREKSLNEFFLMSYFLFYPPLAVPADILSCNSPVTWRAMEMEDIERNSVSASKELLGRTWGNTLALPCAFFDDGDDDSLFCELSGAFSLLLFPPFWFHHETASLIRGWLFVLSDTLFGIGWRARPFFLLFPFLVLPSVIFLPQLLVEACAYPQIIKHLRGYSPSCWNPTENDVPCYERPRKWSRLFSPVCLLR